MLIKNAIFSDCRRYRFTLQRTWNSRKPFVAFVGLNPSTADETNDDPTVRRCIRFAESWGFGGMYMLNAFALRSTDPKELYRTDEPTGGFLNDYWIKRISSLAAITVACWGNHGRHLNRGQAVRSLLFRPHYLTMTGAGEPGHPLYLPKTLKPVLWTGREAVA